MTLAARIKRWIALETHVNTAVPSPELIEEARILLHAVHGFLVAVGAEQPMPHTHRWVYNVIVNAMFCQCGDRIDCDHRLPEAIEASRDLSQKR